jgi:hypothetical protein
VLGPARLGGLLEDGSGPLQSLSAMMKVPVGRQTMDKLLRTVTTTTTTTKIGEIA